MSDFLQVLALALLPAAGNFAGGLLAEFVTVTRRTLSIALHLAAGIIFGVIALELAPRSFEGAPAWLAALAFLAGGLAYILLDTIIERLTARSGDRPAGKGSHGDTVRGSEKSGSAWMIYAAVAVDLFSDGLLLGTGSSLSFGLALVLALGQVTADIPEGFATVANFKDKGVSRSRRLLLAASFLIPVMLGAVLSYFLLRGAAEAIQLAALAFITGMLLIAASEEVIGEAHEAASDSKAATFSLAAGLSSSRW